MRYTETLALTKPSMLSRVWHWSIRQPAPISETRRHRSSEWIRLLPPSWTTVHRKHAAKHSYFWLPCVLCDRPFGGHQSAGTVPDPTYPEHSGRSVVICPRCTRAGRSWRVPHPLEAVLDDVHDEHGHGHDPMRTDCVQCLAHDAAIRDAFTNTPEPPTAA